MTTEKKVRTARQPEAITKGALSLSLEDRVKLRDDLTESIKAEVADLQQKAAIAAKVANGNA